MYANTLTLPSVQRDALNAIRKRIRDRLTSGHSYSPESLASSTENAKREAGIGYLWNRLEAAGLVKMDFPYNDHADMEDLKGDSFNPDVCLPMAGGLRALKSQEKAFERKAEREGVVGMVGRYRLSVDDKWETGDSVWGFVGADDAVDSGYHPDIQANTIEALRKALSSRCPCCHQPKRHK